MAFLDSSAKSYDAGFEGEAKRLAVVLRVLLHDTVQSHSLLGLLGVKATLQYHDVVAWQGSPGAIVFLGLRMGFTKQGLKYSPKLDPPKQRMGFDAWWEGVVMVQPELGGRVTRKGVVLMLANTDGGAHIDPRLDAAYAALSRDTKFGWSVTVGGQPGIVENSPILPAVRQVAHELAGTLREQVPEYLAPADALPSFRRPTSGG